MTDIAYFFTVMSIAGSLGALVPLSLYYVTKWIDALRS